MLRCMYVDLDGTLLGPGGSLLHAGDGSFALDGIRALQACARADVEVVLYSGRMYRSVFEDSRLLGQASFIFELGCGLVLDGELEWLTGGIEPSAQKGSIHDQIEATGAPALLLERFAGALEYHTPWSVGREVSHLFRGLVPSAEAEAVLADAGLEWLRMVDNGVIWTGDPRRDRHEPRGGAGPSVGGAGPSAGEERPPAGGSGTSQGADESQPATGPATRTAPGPGAGHGWGVGPGRVHAYHLIPAASSKALAVARHMQNRGYGPRECIAVGDSREDMDAAGVVGSFWLVANAIERDPTLTDDVAGRAGVRVASASFGAGVYEAVITTLAGGSV
ncbi:MAG: hypothetical protein ACLP8S_23090 [Solirubrobacteraceae bacterium]